MSDFERDTRLRRAQAQDAADGELVPGRVSGPKGHGAGGHGVAARAPGKVAATDALPNGPAGAASMTLHELTNKLELADRLVASLSAALRDPRDNAAGRARSLSGFIDSLATLFDGAEAAQGEAALALRARFDKLRTSAQPLIEQASNTNAGAERRALPLPEDLRGDIEAVTETPLGNVRVHDDEPAHALAASHDARAVTIGSDIHMGAGQLDTQSREGRELLAHEATHVVQASGQPSNHPAAKRDRDSVEAAEVEADAFASDIVAHGRGVSWRPTAAIRSGASMRKEAASTTTAQTPQQIIQGVVAANKPDVWWAYFRANEDKFLGAIENRLSTFMLVEDKRLAWVQGGIKARFRAALQATLGSQPLFIKLNEVVHPANPAFTIDANRVLTEGTPGVVVDGREPIGPMTWNPLAGEAFASDIISRLRESFARMVPRYLVQTDEKQQAAVGVADLVTSQPIDRVTALLLCDEHVVKATVNKADVGKQDAKKAKKQADDPNLFRQGIRFLQDYRWLGGVDPKLWNFIEVKEPRNATPEDVAATLFLDADKSYLAYAVTQSGPYFRIEPSFARRFTEGPNAVDQPDSDNMLDLAQSALATDAAIAQAADERKFDKRGSPLPANLRKLSDTLNRSYRQLERSREVLAPTKLWELLLPALQWVAKYREHIAGLPDDKLIALTPVIEGQQEVLFEAAGAITEVASAASLDNPASPARTNPNSAVVKILRQYATAMGESHLIDSARAQLGQAREAKGSLALALVEESARDTGSAVKDLVGHGGGQWGGDHQLQLAINRARISDMRAKHAAGQNVDPKSVALVAASMKEQGIDAKSKSLYHDLAELRNVARDVQFGFNEMIASAFDSNVRELPGKLSAVLDDLNISVIEPHQRLKQEELQRAGTDEGAQAAALDRIAERTQQDLAAFVDRNDLKKRIGVALGIIEKQQKRTMVVTIVTQIAILIGASVVGGIAGNMVSGFVRGAMIADAATASLGMLRGANAVGVVAGLTVDAGINAGTQLAVQGGSTGEAFAGNLLGTAAVRAALAPLMKAAQTWGHAAEEVKNLSVWQKSLRGGKVVAYQGAVLTTSMITGAATDYVMHRMYHSKEPPTEKQAVDWAVQGGSMAIGMFVGQWVHGFEQRLVHLAEGAGQFTRRIGRIKSLTKALAEHPNQDAALELMIQRHDALQEEARVIEQLAHLPSDSVPPAMIETLRAGNQAELSAVKNDSFANVPLRLAGLVPDDSSGTTWTGHRAQIETALEQSRRVGLDATVLGHDQANGKWQVRYNNKDITIIEMQQRSAVVLAGNDAELRGAAASIKPLAGYQDVVVHGTIDDFEVVINGQIVPVDHRSLAKYIVKSGGGAQKIRLLSCETGKHAKGAAQHLANKLGVEVLAPNDLLHVFEDGSMVIGPTPQRNTGSWETFTPKQASRRFTKWKERPPERAIERLHRGRAEKAEEAGSKTLGDDAVERPNLDARSDLGDALTAGHDYADRASGQIGGRLEAMVKDVALKSVAADVQVESGLRVLDHLFGKNTSAEMKRAAAVIDRADDGPQKEADSKAFRHADDERDRLQKEMVDVMRDPSLAIDARKTKLRELLAQFEAAVRGSPQIDPHKLAFALARKAIEDLRPDVFDNMMAVDANGDLTQKGQRVGTLRELMEQVRQTNAAYQRHGIEEEFVISVSTPADPKTPREVKILTRKPRKEVDLPMGAKKQRHAPVDPSDQSDDGLVVDVGVGLTDYAREVGGEHGMVVKTEFGPDYADPAMMRRDLTWEHTAPLVDVDSVIVLGDALQTLPMMFGERSVKRLFINNINASYAPGGEQYEVLARGLRKVMKPGGRVEVQWTTALETTGGVTKDRGHITGEALSQALASNKDDVPRAYSVNENAPPVTDYDFSVSAPRTQSGKPSKAPPSNPVPEKRWVFTFGD